MILQVTVRDSASGREYPCVLIGFGAVRCGRCDEVIEDPRPAVRCGKCGIEISRIVVSRSGPEFEQAVASS